MANVLYTAAPDYRTYALSRGVSLMKEDGSEMTDDEINITLRKAQDYIDLVFSFKGEQVYDDSAFPRKGLDNYDEDTVPPAVKTATMYVATHIIDGLPFLEGSRASAQIKREVVASNKIETEYATNYQNDAPTQGYTILEAPYMILKRAGLLEEVISGYNMLGMRG